MHQVSITFDRVFDIVRRHRWGGGSGEPCTEFGFESAGKTYPGVIVPEFPEICSGTTVTAILATEGDWQTLRGWINHGTGELTCASTATIAVAGCLFTFVCVFFALYVDSIGWKLADFSLAMLVASIACLIAYTGLKVYQRLHRIADSIRLQERRSDAPHALTDA